MSIRQGYLIFRQGDTYMIEPYLPSRFTHQFAYDQLMSIIFTTFSYSY